MEHIGNLHSMENFVGRGAGGRTLRVGGSEATLGRSAPGAPPTPAGSPTFFEESRGKEHQGQAPGPRVLWPLVPTRWVWGLLALIRLRGYFLRYAKTDLGRIFGIKYAKKHFGERRFPNQAHPPKAFPLGGRCPSAHTGADEGAIWYPTFPCRKGGLLTVAPTGCFSCPVGQPGRPLIRHLR